MLETCDPRYHHLQWRNAARLKRLFPQETRQTLKRYDTLPTLVGLPVAHPGPILLAQYLKVCIALTSYVLSSQAFESPWQIRGEPGPFSTIAPSNRQQESGLRCGCAS